MSPNPLWSHGSCVAGPINEATPQRDVLAWMLLYHPQAVEEWLRRRRAAEAAGIDPDSLDDEVIGS